MGLTFLGRRCLNHRQKQPAHRLRLSPSTLLPTQAGIGRFQTRSPLLSLLADASKIRHHLTAQKETFQQLYQRAEDLWQALDRPGRQNAPKYRCRVFCGRQSQTI